MFTTVPLQVAAGLQAPVTSVMRAGCISLPASATLTDAAAAMRDNAVHAILVTRPDGSPQGWVTARGMLHNHGRDWTLSASAADAITEPPAAIAPSATIAGAVDAFLASGASHVLVAERGAGRPIGVVADSDLVAFLAR